MYDSSPLTHDDIVEIVIRSLRETADQHQIELPDEVGEHATFASFGLDSLAMVQLVTLTSQRLGVELEPELAFNYPTISTFSEHMANGRMA